MPVTTPNPPPPPHSAQNRSVFSSGLAVYCPGNGLVEGKFCLLCMDNFQILAVKAPRQNACHDLSLALNACGVLYQHKLGDPIPEADHILSQVDNPRDGG